MGSEEDTPNGFSNPKHAGIKPAATGFGHIVPWTMCEWARSRGLYARVPLGLGIGQIRKTSPSRIQKPK
jgi:hypothetical protein